MKKTYWLTPLALVLALVARGGPGDSVFSGDIQASEPPDRLVLAPAVADNLALLFSQFSTELVLCLEGERRGREIHVYNFHMPHILMSQPGRVQATACPSDPSIVGTWHNHPAPGLSLTGHSHPGSLERNCYLSRTDIRDFMRREDALVSVVACAPYTFAYWWRHDVEERGGDEVALLPPPTAQLVQAQNGDPAEASALTQAR